MLKWQTSGNADPIDRIGVAPYKITNPINTIDNPIDRNADPIDRIDDPIDRIADPAGVSAQGTKGNHEVRRWHVNTFHRTTPTFWRG